MVFLRSPEFKASKGSGGKKLVCVSVSVDQAKKKKQSKRTWQHYNLGNVSSHENKCQIKQLYFSIQSCLILLDLLPLLKEKDSVLVLSLHPNNNRLLPSSHPRIGTCQFKSELSSPSAVMFLIYGVSIHAVNANQPFVSSKNQS